MCTKFDIYIVITFFLIATHLIKQLFGKSLNDLEERWYLLIYELSNLKSDWKNDNLLTIYICLSVIG
jgi:hypothetical protein